MIALYHIYDRNRIRNLEEKISELDPEGQVVKGITDYFCQTKISRLQGELEVEKERVRVFLVDLPDRRSYLTMRMHFRAVLSTTT